MCTINFLNTVYMFSCSESLLQNKGNCQNYYTRTGPAFLQENWCSLNVFPPPLPYLKRWRLVGITPTLSGLGTQKKIQSFLCQFTSNVM